MSGGARLKVRLTPNARREGFGDVHVDSAGETWLKASVRAVPEDGKANEALVALVAKSARIAKGRIAVASGTTNRAKVLFVSGADEAEIAALAALGGG